MIQVLKPGSIHRIRRPGGRMQLQASWRGPSIQRGCSERGNRAANGDWERINGEATLPLNPLTILFFNKFYKVKTCPPMAVLWSVPGCVP